MNVTNYRSYRDDTASGVIKTKAIDTGAVVAVLCYEFIREEKILCILFVTVKDKENKDIILYDLSKLFLEIENDAIEHECLIKSIEELLIRKSDIRIDDARSDLQLFMKYIRSEVTCKDEENMEFHKD